MHDSSARLLDHPCRILLLAACLFLLGGTPAWARFARPDLSKVPVERLKVNLTAAVEKAPKDAATHRNLARVHAMAYASKQPEVEINNRSQQPWFGYTPRYVPFVVQKGADTEAELLAKVELAAAIKHYEIALEIKPDDLPTLLGLAWANDQANHSEQAVKLYRQVITKAAETEGKLKRGRLGGNYLTVEAAGYLIPLLDEKADAEEIAHLQAESKRLKALRRPVTPIAIPLHDDLNDTDIHDREARVAFDADGSGLRNRWTWLNDNAAWLVHDPRGTGEISSATQMFGNASFMLFWENGYDALAVLDDDRDQQLTGRELRGLALWHDANRNGRSEPGEVRSLAAHGIKSLSCSYAKKQDCWQSPRGVEFQDGTTRASYDIVLQPTK